MRFVPVLLLLSQGIVVTSAAAQPAKTPRLDVNGDPLPDGAIARLGTLRSQTPGGIHDVHDVALSPDGRTVVTAIHRYDRETQIYFMDTSTGKSLRKYDLAGINGFRMQFTPDGKGLVFNRLLRYQTG